MAFRLIILSYIAFTTFFHAECIKYNSFYIENFFYFSFFDAFLKNHIVLKGIEKQEQVAVLNTINAGFWVILLRRNRSVQGSIEECEKKCNEALFCLQNQNKERLYLLQELFLEKKQVFSFNENERKTLFHYIAYDIFGTVTKKCTLFCEKIRNFE